MSLVAPGWGEKYQKFRWRGPGFAWPPPPEFLGKGSLFAKTLKTGHTQAHAAAAVGPTATRNTMAEFDNDLQSIQEARRLAEAARDAQRQFAHASQAEVDRVCAAMAEAAYAAAE